MRDRFRIIGDEVWFGPWHVADLRKDVPATVRDQIEGDLADGTYEQGYKDGYDSGVEDYRNGDI